MLVIPLGIARAENPKDYDLQKGYQEHLECSVFFTAAGVIDNRKTKKDEGTKYLMFAKILDDRVMKLADKMDKPYSEVRAERKALREKFRNELKGHRTNMVIEIKQRGAYCLKMLKHPKIAF